MKSMIDRMLSYKNELMDAVLTWLPNIGLALLSLFLGFYVVNKLIKLLDKLLLAQGIEPTLRGFLESFISVFLKVVVVLFAVSFMGVKTASFIALFGAAGLAVGLALQGSLANFAGGVLILFFKPFKVGDFIVAQNKEGVVERIMIFNTMIRKINNEMIIIPNGELANGVIENLTHERERRLDISLGVGYEADIDHVRKVLMAIINQQPLILCEPKPEVLVAGHGEYAVDILVRVWLKADDYWDVNFYLWEASKKAFDKEGISIPFPQQEVRLHP